MISTQHGDAPPWLVRARREIGVTEVPGRMHNTRILQYHTATRLKATADEVAWCAAFVCWVLEQEGITSTKSAAAKSYATYGRPCKLTPGAILFFGKRDPDAKGTGHVTFADRVDETLGIVWCVGGNQGNKVSSAARRISDIAACRWPQF
jgi:uncharacterized protein (TIGR02594 family)